MPGEITAVMCWAAVVLVLTTLGGLIDISKILCARRKAETIEIISTLKGLPEEITIGKAEPSAR